MQRFRITCLSLVLTLAPAVVFAAIAGGGGGGGLPWDTTLNTVVQDVRFVVVPALLTLGLIIVGVSMMHTEHHMGRTILGTLIGGAVAAGAVALIPLLWTGATF